MTQDTDATQAVIAADAPAAVEAQAPTEITFENRDLLDSAARDALLFGDSPRQAIEQPPVEPVVEQEPVAEAVIEPEPAEVEPEEPDEPHSPKNVRFSGLDPKLSSFLTTLKAAQRSNPNVNPAEVARLVGYEAPEVGPKAATEAIPPAEVVPSPLQTMEAELADIETRLEAFDGEVPTAESRALNRELAEKLSDIKVAKLEARLEITKQADTAKAREEQDQSRKLAGKEVVKSQVLVQYPTANDSTSVLGKEISLIWSQMQADPKHPNWAEYDKDSFPEFITQEAVKSKTIELKGYGLSDAQAVSAITGKPIVEAKGPAAVAPATPRPLPRSTPLISAGQTSAPTPAPAITTQQALDRSRTDPKFRDEMLFGSGSNAFVVR